MAQASSPTTTDINRTFHGCSKIQDYEVMGKLGEGTFGEVHKARSRKTDAIVALKKILMHNEKDGFPITALREIKLLKMLSHENILKLEEMAVERVKGEGRKRAVLYMVTPYMDHDLSGLLDNPEVRFTEPQIKCYMLQLLEGLRYLHDNHILHRDMKAANLLINNRGLLQIADFGLARHYDEPVPQPGKGCGEARREYTTLVVTRWYRPPELLLQLRRYTPAIDMWGAGCVFGEMFKRKPILTGKSDLNQAQIIFDLVGSPNDENMPGWNQLPGCEGVKTFQQRSGNLSQVFRELSPSAISLLSDLLKLDWRKRINAIDALNHPYFREHPRPARREDLPRFQDSHELDRRNARGHNAALPPAPAGGTVGMGPNGEWIGSGNQGPPGQSGPPNGGPWMNGDRHQRGGRPHDRGPPGSGPPGPSHPGARGGYDSRPPHSGYQPPSHRTQAWPGDQHRSSYQPPGARHGLPPPPPEGRHQLPQPPHRGGGTNRDTYIPSYSEGRHRNDRLSMERDERPRDGRRGSRDSKDSKEGRPPSRDDRRRDDREMAYRDRGSDRLDYGHDHRRTRSRSPGSRDNRDTYRVREGHRDRDRDREQHAYGRR